MGKTKEAAFTEVWAPALFSYTGWVIRKALSMDIHQLYFLARDARMAYRIACEMAERERLPLTCHYLEGSRYAWRMAEFFLPDTDPIEKICMGGVHVTLRTILKRGGLTDEEAEQTADCLGKRGQLDIRLSYREIQRLRPVLADCVPLKDRIREHAGRAYDHTIRYLEQEKIMEREPFAIVDSGWVGSLQQTLEHLRQSAAAGDQEKKGSQGSQRSQGKQGSQRSQIHGFYFGLYELPKGADPSVYHTYYFRPYKDIEKKVRFSNCLFEAVCSAEEGMTLGYREQGGKMTPVYETEQNPNIRSITEHNRVLEQLLAAPDDWDTLMLDVREVRKRLETLMGTPTAEMAAEYGDYLYSDDVLGSSMQPVAAVLSEREIRNLHALRRLLLMNGLAGAELKESAWPEGSVVRAGKRINYHLFQIRAYKRLIYWRKRFRKR